MVLEVDEIRKILPHRAPFLLVDRITELEPFKSATGIKNVTFNEPQFHGHFPHKSVMPGVLLLEAMAQVGGVCMLYPEENRGKIALFGAMDNIKFKRPVIPGDQVIMKAVVTKVRAILARFMQRPLLRIHWQLRLILPMRCSVLSQMQ